jgi:SAM-dependent methyltransferase
VRDGHIESRRLATDQAIVDAVLSRSPRSVLDIGCGEGWLAGVLGRKGISVVGVDAVPELIERARASGVGDFRVLSYSDIAAGALRISVEAVVCNFALFGDGSVVALFAAVSKLLTLEGSFIVQTLHPVFACGDLPYRDGWREGSWTGFGAEFTDPPRWYFRTLESWNQLFERSGLIVRETREPLHPISGVPASVIFIAQATA